MSEVFISGAWTWMLMILGIAAMYMGVATKQSWLTRVGVVVTLAGAATFGALWLAGMKMIP